MRFAVAGALLLLGFSAPVVQACELVVTPKAGESRVEATERLYREDQDELWADSDVVFVGEVISLRRADDTFEVEVLPRGALKGDAGRAPITYPFEESGVGCGFRSFPKVTFPGIFYASRISGDALHVDGMLNVEDIRDQALADRLFAVLEMTPFPVEPVKNAEPMLARLLLNWVWLAGVAGLFLLVGIWIGRASKAVLKK